MTFSHPGDLVFAIQLSESHFNLLLFTFQLHQRGEGFKVFGNVSIKDRAIVLRHIQSRMTKEPLKSEGIAPTIHKVLLGKCMTEQVYACLLYSTLSVVLGDAAP